MVESGKPALVLDAKIVADLLELLLAVAHHVDVVDAEELQRPALSNPSVQALHLRHWRRGRGEAMPHSHGTEPRER